MIKYLLASAALVLAGVPAALGLTSNASFSQDVPVRVPEQAQTAPATPAPVSDDGTPDRGRGETEPADDHGGDVPRAQRTEAGDDRDTAVRHHAEPGDDHGGDIARDDRTEVGDDRGGSDTSGPSASGSDDSGSDGSGHGTDDGSSHGGDGSGSSGGGSDDGSGHN